MSLSSLSAQRLGFICGLTSGARQRALLGEGAIEFCALKVKGAVELVEGYALTLKGALLTLKLMTGALERL